MCASCGHGPTMIEKRYISSYFVNSDIPFFMLKSLLILPLVPPLWTDRSRTFPILRFAKYCRSFVQVLLRSLILSMSVQRGTSALPLIVVLP